MSSNKNSEALKHGDKVKDLSDVEMIFGTPVSPKAGNPDVHLIANERRHGKEPLPNHQRGGSESDTDTVSSQPLLEPDRGRPKPPIAGPEIDDLDDERDDDRKTGDHYPGIDDGLLEPGDKKPEGHDSHGGGDDEHKEPNGTDIHHDGGTDGKWWHEGGDETDFPYDGINGFGPRFGIDDRPISPMMPGSIPDVNTYQQKKNLAQGMMDLALLSANANQLRYVLESSDIHPYYYPSLVFISLSIILQIAVGVGLIMNSRYNVKDEKDICKADKINNMTVLGVFLITIVNVFITSFSVAGNPSSGTAVQNVG